MLEIGDIIVWINRFVFRKLIGFELDLRLILVLDIVDLFQAEGDAIINCDKLQQALRHFHIGLHLQMQEYLVGQVGQILALDMRLEP